MVICVIFKKKNINSDILIIYIQEEEQGRMCVEHHLRVDVGILEADKQKIVVDISRFPSF